MVLKSGDLDRRGHKACLLSLNVNLLSCDANNFNRDQSENMPHFLQGPLSGTTDNYQKFGGTLYRLANHSSDANRLNLFARRRY